MPKLIQKRGKKGATYFVQFSADDGFKSTAIRDSDQRGAIDVLLSGKMTVVPPSLHPDTAQPYQWGGESLLDVDPNDLPILTKRKLDLLRNVVGSKHVKVLVTGESTHDAGVAFTAQLVRWGCADDEIEQIVRALLPANYSGDSLEELSG
jgi:hypothetical protein